MNAKDGRFFCGILITRQFFVYFCGVKLNLKEKIVRFREWRQTPHQVPPLSGEEHICYTCGTQYVGNFCPRCGQAGRVGRFSAKTAVLNFFDVWGLGSRNIFLTARDLILRPGYMIRDYLKGMQMAYFPPFKMYFLLAALSLLITNGLNIKGQTDSAVSIDETRFEKPADDDLVSEVAVYKAIMLTQRVMTFQQKYPNIFSFAGIIFISGVLYLFFRKSPNIPDLRFSEFLVALTYSQNMYSIYTILMDFLCIGGYVNVYLLLLIIIPLKQLSGFGWVNTTLRTLLGTLLMLLLVTAILIGIFVLFVTSA